MNLPHAEVLADHPSGNGAPAPRIAPYHYTLSEPEQRLRALERSVGLLIAHSKLGKFWSKGFREVRRLLEAVPLATPEFIAATRHLRNAFDYSELNEFGAAAFELRIVRGILGRL
jgi:hypothetical protein